jgi:hypothetical protein
MIQNQNSPDASKIRINLFHFTEREERMIERAILLSQKFMDSYGRGRKPMMVDRSKYL